MQVPMHMSTMPALKLLFAVLDKSMVGTINEYIDNHKLQDHSNQLVGQIRQDKKSAQLQLDMNDLVPKKLGEFLKTMAATYSKEHNIVAKLVP